VARSRGDEIRAITGNSRSATPTAPPIRPRNGYQRRSSSRSFAILDGDLDDDERTQENAAMLFEGTGEVQDSIDTSNFPTETPTQPSVEGTGAVQDYRRRPSAAPSNPGYEDRPVQPAGNRRPLTCRRCYHTGTTELPGHIARDCTANYRRDGPKIIQDYKALPNFLKKNCSLSCTK